jgi:hypothetical protein
MKLLFLHGAPASGKLTVAKAVLEMAEGRLCDNHAAIDLARTVFDFGAPGFWELVHAVRINVLEFAVQAKLPLLVMTYCYAEPDDRPAFEQFARIVESAGGSVIPVFLSCSREAAVQRIGNADRRERRKITTEEGLDRFLGQFSIVPVPAPGVLQLDTAAVSPGEAAHMIVPRLGL